MWRTQRQFLTEETHSHDVSPAEAVPGDLLFWQPDGGTQSQIHHAAILTAVAPADLLYTQHSSVAVNKSLGQNEMKLEITRWGRQVIHIVRVIPAADH